MRSVRELSDLGGRRVLLTGGAGHIGLAAAESVIELGASVVILDVDARACQERAAALGPRVLPLPCDLSNEEAARSAVRRATEMLGGLDILIHCAAYVGTTRAPGWAVPFEQQSVAAWDNALRVNLTAAFVMAQEGRAALSASGYGSIVLFASTYGLVGPDMGLYADTDLANPVAYGVSKGGLIQLTRYLATVMAPGVRVNAIAPGGVSRGQPDAFRRRYETRTPLKRMAFEEDLKGAVAYLASDLSSYVTGHTLVVDGGWTAW